LQSRRIQAAGDGGRLRLLEVGSTIARRVRFCANTSPTMTRSIILFASALLLAAGCNREESPPPSTELVESHERAEGEAQDPERNVVQTEMQLLTTVLEKAVRAVGE